LKGREDAARKLLPLQEKGRCGKKTPSLQELLPLEGEEGAGKKAPSPSGGRLGWGWVMGKAQTCH
jgi:hypothetical protein